MVLNEVCNNIRKEIERLAESGHIKEAIEIRRTVNMLEAREVNRMLYSFTTEGRTKELLPLHEH